MHFLRYPPPSLPPLTSLGLLASSCFASELLLIRTARTYLLSGDHCALYFSLFVGLLGSLSLLLYNLLSEGGGATIANSVERIDLVILSLGGIADSVGMCTALHAASIGVSGIAFAVANTDCVYVVVFNYVVRG